MKRILVATDFSARSDRALARAGLIAKQFSAALTLVHVIDFDQPQRLIETEKAIAAELLDQCSATVRDGQGVACDWRLVVDDAFSGILRAAEESAADLIVLGAHRRQLLSGVFVGTTAERTIRRGSTPVLMANGDTVRAYQNVLLAIDLSEASATAARALGHLGLGGTTDVTALHAFESTTDSLIIRSAMTSRQIGEQIAQEAARARNDVSAFIAAAQLAVSNIIVRPGAAAETIAKCATEIDADVIVVGTRGRSGLMKLMVGSVAEDILRDADRDVLAVPPSWRA